MEIPNPLIMQSRNRAMALEALSLLCVHLQSLEDLYSLTIKFSHSPSSLSEIINAVAQHIEDTLGFFWNGTTRGLCLLPHCESMPIPLPILEAPESLSLDFGLYNPPDLPPSNQ